MDDSFFALLRLEMEWSRKSRCAITSWERNTTIWKVNSNMISTKSPTSNRPFAFIAPVFSGVWLNKVGNAKVSSRSRSLVLLPHPLSLLDCGINAHRHCKDQVVMECRQKRQHPVNKQSSVTDARSGRSSFRTRKTRKQKGTQTEDINFSSTSSSSATSESCTSSEDEQQHHQQQHQQQQIIDKTTHHYPWHLRKPSSLKRRKQISSDSNDDYYYTHPPSPQQAGSLTTITTTMTNSSTSTNTIPAPQLIPRGPLICSDSFEKWNDRCFTWNRPLPPTSLLSSISRPSATISESTSTKQDGEENEQQGAVEGRRSFLRTDASDDDACFTSNPDETTVGPSSLITIDSDDERPTGKKGSPTELPSPMKTEQSQQEIFERLRQAEEVSDPDCEIGVDRCSCLSRRRNVWKWKIVRWNKNFSERSRKSAR